MDEEGEQARFDASGDLCHPDDADPVSAISESAGEGAQEDYWKKLGHRHNAEPRAGMGQGPGEPADRHTLHPHTDQGDGIAAGINAVVSVGESPDDTTESTGK